MTRNLRCTRPDAAAVSRYLATQRGLPFTYDQVGATRRGEAVDRRFVVDRNEIVVGRGRDDFATAKAALQRWEMFPSWATVEPRGTPIVEGEVVSVVAQVMTLWWLAAARIVYVLDEPARFAFGYGTLPGHVECGEERFSVELRGDDTVVYSLLAFSRPRHWAARVAYPLARRAQRRFARDSLATMAAIVSDRRRAARPAG